jgi:hypothetical protein
MKNSYTAAIVIALATLATSQAMAAYTPTDARDNKDDLTGMTFREIAAGVNAAKSGVSGKTREQVRAEAVSAQRSLDAGDTKVSNTGGMTSRQVAAGVAAARSGVYSKTREQVRAEAVAARSHDARDNKDDLTGMTYREMSGS